MARLVDQLLAEGIALALRGAALDLAGDGGGIDRLADVVGADAFPTAMDMPRVDSIILESRSGVGPFGAKGIGEPAMTPVAPAIANAVADAIGTRVFELPITPEKIVMALRQAEASG